MSIDVIRAALLAAPAVVAFVGDKVGPRDAMADQQPPYIILAVEKGDPYLTLQGPIGDRSEIELTAWSASYLEATSIANAARTALEAAGYFAVHEPGDIGAFQQDVEIYGHAYVFQVFD